MPERVRIDTWRKPEHAHTWVGRSNTESETAFLHNGYTNAASGSQHLIQSEGHQGWDTLGSDDFRNVGGDFMVTRRFLTETNSGKVHNRTVNVNTGSGDNNPFSTNYVGEYYAKHRLITDSDFPVEVYTSPTEMGVLGTTAIARVIPTNPIVGVSTAFGELSREGIPSIPGIKNWEARALRTRNAGSEYLNLEFGWFPLLNDIRKAYEAITNFHKLVDNFSANSGKLLHRRYQFETTFGSSDPDIKDGIDSFPDPAALTGFWVITGNERLTETWSTKIKTWFSGAFTYWVPPFDPNGDNRVRNRQLAHKLFDARITPELLWNLTPWTWALDWFANTGDFLRNVSAFQNDNLVMPYGYIMRERTDTVRYENVNNVMKRSYEVLNLSQTLVTVTKQRQKATPYGFGILPADLSPKQWAILGALGLSRAPGKFD